MLIQDIANRETAAPAPRWPASVWRILTDSVEIAEPFMATAGLLGVVAFPLFYAIWRYLFPQPYENLWLRLCGSLLCLPLALKYYWPERFTRLLPVYWQLTVLYSLPFLFAYMTLENGMNEVWVLSTIGGVFILTFFVEWRSAIVLFAAGTMAAWLLHESGAGERVSLLNYLKHLVIFLFPLTFGGIVNHKLQQYRRMQSTFDKRLRNITTENARVMHEQNKLLSRFLSNTIVRRLWQSQREHGLDQAIASITRQEKRFCGIMQADIRNFTKMFDQESEIEVAQVIRLCFTEITEIGQDLAVIKPVGDCIFMYSDDLGGRGGCVRNILALGVFFVHSVEQINRLVTEQGMPGLNFGIAIHAGEAIYGNLASDTLIDPTIIGIHVNKTARLEELTKLPAIRALIGSNAIVLSEEMVEYGRNFLPREALMPIRLDELGVQVRDFPDIKTVYALTSDTAQAFYGRAVEHIESQRRGLPAQTGRLEVNTYRGVPYYYEMHGSGPGTSWTMLIDVQAMSNRAVRTYAAHSLEGFDFEINSSDGRWLVVSTAPFAGEYDETDVEAEIFKIIEGLQQAASH